MIACALIIVPRFNLDLISVEKITQQAYFKKRESIHIFEIKFQKFIKLKEFTIQLWAISLLYVHTINIHIPQYNNDTVIKQKIRSRQKYIENIIYVRSVKQIIKYIS